MSDSPVWDFWIAINLTCSLKEFITFNINPSKSLNQALNFLKCDFNQKMQKKLLEELDKALKDNDWAISCKEKVLIDLSEQARISCADERIIIIKDFPARISSVQIKENDTIYLLVATLSQNGRKLYCWNDQAWGEIEVDWDTSYEPYYFYYCKVNQIEIKAHLDSKGYETIYSLFENPKSPSENSLPHISETFEINRRGSADESKECYEIIGEEKESKSKDQASQTEIEYVPIIKNSKQNIKQLEELEEQSKITIKDLENEIDRLKKEREASEEMKNDYESRISGLKNENKGYCATIQQFQETINNMRANQDFQLSQLEKLNHSLVDENTSLREKCRMLEENIIIELSPNQKHGLPNLGNTCYLNSLLQIFSSTPSFAIKLQNSRNPFSQSLKNLLSNMKISNSPRTISDLTKTFWSNLLEAYPYIESYTQQDPKEVLSMILSKLSEENKQFDAFTVTFEQEISCCKKHKSNYTDISSFLLIPPQSKECLQSFIYNKIYCTSNIRTHCTKCNKEVDTSITVKPCKWPNQLVIYFPNSPESICHHISIDKNTAYELYGAICYYQDESLHYTAFTKDGEIWNEYNDENVEAKTIGPFLVYLAFYSKVQPIPGSKANKSKW